MFWNSTPIYGFFKKNSKFDLVNPNSFWEYPINQSGINLQIYHHGLTIYRHSTRTKLHHLEILELPPFLIPLTYTWNNMIKI